MKIDPNIKEIQRPKTTSDKIARQTQVIFQKELENRNNNKPFYPTPTGEHPNSIATREQFFNQAVESTPDEFISYESTPDWFDNRANFHSNSRYSDTVRERVYAGTHEYNPSTGVLRKLESPIDIPQEAQDLSRTDWQETETGQELIARQNQAAAGRSTQEFFDNPATYAPSAIIGGAPALGRALGAAGMRVAGSNFAKNLPGYMRANAQIGGREITGANLLNAANAGGIGYAVNEGVNPESGTRESFREAYDNPTAANLIEAGVNVGLLGLDAMGLYAMNPGLARSTMQGVKNLSNKFPYFVNRPPASSLYDVSKGFKSEIDWAKWNKEIPDNKALMREYNAIEQQAKANGTWMKNPDGSEFKGTPEQFVQQNSENFKKAFGNSKLVNSDGSPLINYHGTPYPLQGDKFDLSYFGKTTDDGWLGKGIYTTPKRYKAKAYSQGYPGEHLNSNPQVYELYGNVTNPVSTGNINRDNLGKFFGRDDDVFFKDYDAVIDDFMGSPGFNSRKKDLEEILIRNPNQLKSAIGNNGMFDMTNPNIYKALFPAAIGTGVARQLSKENKEIPMYKKGGFIPRKYQQGGRWPQSLPSGLNPKNWGVSDYSEHEQFGQAFNQARQDNRNNFMWQGQRYSTDLAPDVQQDPRFTPEELEFNNWKADVLHRQLFKESAFDPKAVSNKGAQGIAQIMPNTLTWLRDQMGDQTLDPNNVNDAIKMQKWYMDNLWNASFIDKPNQSDEVRMAKTLGAYNWGRGNMLKFLNEQVAQEVDIYGNLDWVDNIPDNAKEARDYINIILNRQSTDRFERDYKQHKHRMRDYYYGDSLGTYKKGGYVPKYQSGGGLSQNQMRFLMSNPHIFGDNQAFSGNSQAFSGNISEEESQNFGQKARNTLGQIGQALSPVGNLASGMLPMAMGLGKHMMDAERNKAANEYDFIQNTLNSRVMPTKGYMAPIAKKGGFMKRKDLYQSGGLIESLGYKDYSPWRNRPFIDISSDTITMNEVGMPLLLVPDVGSPMVGMPNQGDINFPGASKIREIPLAQMGMEVEGEEMMMEDNTPQPIQAEKGEMIATPEAEIFPVNATKTHKQMDDYEITDMLTPGSYVFSNHKSMKLNKADADDMILSIAPMKYGEGGKSKYKEFTMGDFFKKKQELPADVARRIRNKYKTVGDIKDADGFSIITDMENMMSRMEPLQALIHMSEEKKGVEPDETLNMKTGGAVSKYKKGKIVPKYQSRGYAQPPRDNRFMPRSSWTWPFGKNNTDPIQEPENKQRNPPPGWMEREGRLWVPFDESYNRFYNWWQPPEEEKLEKDKPYRQEKAIQYRPENDTLVDSPRESRPINPPSQVPDRSLPEDRGNLRGRSGLSPEILKRLQPSDNMLEGVLDSFPEYSTPLVQNQGYKYRPDFDNQFHPEKSGKNTGRDVDGNIVDLDAFFKDKLAGLDDQFEESLARTKGMFRRSRGNLFGGTLMGALGVMGQDPYVESPNISSRFVDQMQRRVPEQIPAYYRQSMNEAVRPMTRQIFENTPQMGRAASMISTMPADIARGHSELAANIAGQNMQAENAYLTARHEIAANNELGRVDARNRTAANVNQNLAMLSGLGVNHMNQLNMLNMGQQTHEDAHLASRNRNEIEYLRTLRQLDELNRTDAWMRGQGSYRGNTPTTNINITPPDFESMNRRFEDISRPPINLQRLFNNPVPSR